MEFSREDSTTLSAMNGELVELAEQTAVVTVRGSDSGEEEGKENNGEKSSEVIADGTAGPHSHTVDTLTKGAQRKMNESLSFHDLSFEVTQKKFFRKLPNKIILNSIRSAAANL